MDTKKKELLGNFYRDGELWTSTGLKVTVSTLNKFYELKRQTSDRFMETYPIVFDEWLPDWNYTVVPTTY